jgi:hypothetical protein
MTRLQRIRRWFRLRTNPVARRRSEAAKRGAATRRQKRAEHPRGQTVTVATVAERAVQHLADSEPSADAIEGMERLKGTPQESMFVVGGNELQAAIECVLSDSIYDGEIIVQNPEPPAAT